MVYFLQCDNKRVHQDRSDLWTRPYSLMSVQLCCPYPLTLLGIISDEAIGAQPYALEGALHDQFAQALIGGEWFRPVPELLDYIAKHAVALQPAHNIKWHDKRLLYSKSKHTRRQASLEHSPLFGNYIDDSLIRRFAY